MQPIIRTDSEWNPNTGIVTTRLSGPVSTADVEMWEQGLMSVMEQIPDNGTFRIFVNFFGLGPQSVEAHKRYRSVIPLLLSRYGWRVGYLALFPEADALALTTTRGIRCIGAVHVHQDAFKIEEYDRRFGNATERFFTDPAAALSWLGLSAA